MRVLSSMLFSKAVCGLFLLASCKPAVVDTDKQDAEKMESRPSAEVQATTPTAGQQDTTRGNNSTASKPFVAILKKQEAVPDALLTGLLTISNNCLIVKISSQPSKFYTAVLPNNSSLISSPSNEKLVQIGKKTIALDVETSIPGGQIFVDIDEYIQDKVPVSCPPDLFGIGE